MIKKVTTLLIILTLVFFTGSSAFADDKPPPPPSSKNGSFSKGNFSKNNAWNKNGKASGAPNPAGTGSTGGTRIPISNGLTFLLIGSAVYILKKVLDESREIPLSKNTDH